MSLLDEMYETVTAYRHVAATGGYGTVGTIEKWELVGELDMYIEASTPDDTIMNNQNYQGGVYKGLYPILYKGLLLEGDGIVDADGKSYVLKGEPQPWKFIQGHMACVLNTEQFVVPTE